MGFFDKLTNAFAGVDTQLLQSGTLGRGIVVGAMPSSGMTVQKGAGMVERPVAFQVQVLLDGGIPYLAQVEQRVAEVYIPQLQTGSAQVAVRVDPVDPQHIAIDFQTPPPPVRLGRSTGPGSAADLIATGRDGAVVIAQSSPMGYQNYKGYEVHAFALTVVEGAPQPYQVSVATAVPPEGLAVLFPGSRLPAKLGAGLNDVIIDFERAVGVSAV